MSKSQRKLVLHQITKPPVLEFGEIPTLIEGEILIKVEASTINPIDRFILDGSSGQKLPIVAGKEGTGVVIEANGEKVQKWIGKRVTFLSMKGGVWAEYVAVDTQYVFEITNNVPVGHAACGVVNPLTAVGFIENFKSLGIKGGIIQTGASSSLGRQVNRLAIQEKIPLLNFVRRKEQVDILKKQGATHVFITEENWQEKFKSFVEENGEVVVYDVLGGGPISEFILANLNSKSYYFISGTLASKSLSVPSVTVCFSGVTIKGFLLFNWWSNLDKQTKQRVRNQYGNLLVDVLGTQIYKQLGLESIEEALQLSISKATEGKILLKI